MKAVVTVTGKDKVGIIAMASAECAKYGANIIDMTLIMPLAAFVSGKTLPISESAGRVDLPACLLVGLIATVPTMIKSKFSKWQGFLLLGIYIAYLVITCVAV